jgi:hypothetical protein
MAGVKVVYKKRLRSFTKECPHKFEIQGHLIRFVENSEKQKHQEELHV